MLNKQMSVAEVASAMGVSMSWLNKRRVYGGGPVFQKCGARVTYNPVDVEAYLAERRVRSTSETRVLN